MEHIAKILSWRTIGILNLIPSYMFGGFICELDSAPQYKSTGGAAGLIMVAPIGTIITGNPIWLLPNGIITMGIIGSIFLLKHIHPNKIHMPYGT